MVLGCMKLFIPLYERGYTAFVWLTGKGGREYMWTLLFIKAITELSESMIEQHGVFAKCLLLLSLAVTVWASHQAALWHETNPPKDNVINLPMGELWMAWIPFWAVLTVIVAILSLIALDWLTLFQCALTGMWIISLLYHGPGGKSVFAKIKEKITNKSKSIAGARV